MTLPRSRRYVQGWYPTLKHLPYVVRFQPECVADRQEGEESARVIAEKPILSLPRALHEPLLRLKLFLKAEKSIFEYGVHQCRLRAHGSEFDPIVQELLRQCVVIGRCLAPRVPARRSRLG